jgi:hypothetical protein
MEHLLHDLLSPVVSGVLVALTLFVLGWHTIGAYRGFRGEIRSLFVWSGARNLVMLQKRRDRLIRLHNSDREYYGWLLSCVLLVLALFAVVTVYEGLMTPPTGWGRRADIEAHLLLGLVRYGMGCAAYWIAISRWRDYRALQRFDHTMETLDRKIATLASKQPLQPVPSGTYPSCRGRDAP